MTRQQRLDYLFDKMLTREEVLKIAHLARLELTDAEVTSYQEHLGKILDYVKELNSISIGEKEFMHHIPADAQSLRKQDIPIVSEAASLSSLLKNSPESEDNCFLLPPVVERS